jgi:membrane-bound lytic murein transglycosylase A
MPADVQREAPAWLRLCQDALRTQPADDASTRAWLMQRLTPYRVLPLDANSPGEGLATGYFEPLIDASRTPRGSMRVPLHAPPADLATRKPWFTRAQIETEPAAQAALRGREIAFVTDPLDALLLQVQGSGRVRLIAADGSTQTVRLAFAGHNDQPYRSIGGWLIDQGELRSGQASWPAIRDWARRFPKRVPEMLAANPRVVFFREELLPDPNLGPRGAQGVALTPERSIAVDPKSLPYGTPVWLDTTEPLTATPLRRLVLAQDTGSAITGAVRADYFWGWGDRAEQQAGRMKQSLKMWVLWPK